MDDHPSLAARALEQFDAYADMPPDARERALRALRGSDPALHDEIARLLEADALRGALQDTPQKILAEFERNGSENELSDQRVGSTLGAWHIEGVIGTGGMGRVYLARRADGQYMQEVALKCLRIESTSPVLASVIRNERNVLAMLEHPNIATLLDGGVTPDGCPWFAMQRIQGEPIDAWCDHQRLDLRERVQLFLQLAEGLRYAHGKGALHSDLKPSNVLVDESGRPILLDFGLSSLIRRSGEPMPRQVAMSLGYTAPEVPTDGCSVASDIYSLGMLLHGMLSGGNAHCSTTIAQAMPKSPSECARSASNEVALARGFKSAHTLATALQGDLDSIVMSCLATRPENRPASVAHLQEDLRAWLAFRPVSTRATPLRHRLHLFMRRHRIATAATILILIGAAIGFGINKRLHDRATDHADAEQAMRRLYERTFDALTTGGLGQSPLMSSSMLHDAESRLREGSAGGAMDHVAASLMLTTLARSYTALGDYRHAEELLVEAQTTGGERPELQSSLHAARAHLLNIQSKFKSAFSTAQAGLAHLDAVSEGSRETTRLQLDVELARAQWGMTHIAEGRQTLQEALSRAEGLAEHDSRPLASLLIQQGQWQRLFLNYEAALATYERAIALTRQRAPLIADEATVELVSTLKQLSRHEEAVQRATELLARRRHILGEDHPETGRAWQVLGASQFWRGDAESALTSLQRSEAILTATLGAHHPETARTLLEIGLVRANNDPDGDAERIVRPALADIEAVYGPDHLETSRGVAILAAVLAVRLAGRADSDVAWQEVIDLFERRVEIGRRQGLPTEHDQVVLIKAQLRFGKPSEVQQATLERLVTSLEHRFGPMHDTVHNARLVLVEVYLARNQDGQAKALLEHILRETADMPTTLKTQSSQIDAREKLGNLLLKEGRRDEARSMWEKGLAMAQKIERQPSIQRLEQKLASLASSEN